jgi:hypothetical protein
MDRSFLSQPDVVAASRSFVCVRLATYEDKDEGAFLKAFLVTRSGELENTVFTILAPDGKQQLVRASRETNHLFNGAGRMAETMKRIAGEYPTKGSVLPPSELPKVANVRLAINVAACDNQPLVLVFGGDAGVRKELEERLAALAWSDRFIGQFVYASASSPKDLAEFEGAKFENGILVIQSDKFGQKGKVLKRTAGATREELARCLSEGAKLFEREEKTFAGHVREGHSKGVFWETVLPVTDPMELRARERGRILGPKQK